MSEAFSEDSGDGSTAIAVTIAGSDSGGGAGIQADLKTFSALGVYGASVITALTAQNTLGVNGIHDVPPAFVAAQMDAVFSDLKVQAVKIGMLSRPEVIETVAAGLDRHKMSQVVLDPVMISASGHRLLVPEAIESLQAVLLRRALLITPNLPEAAALLHTEPATTNAQVRRQAERLMKFGPKAVLIKGGHGEGSESIDVLLDEEGFMELAAPRVETMNTHGTGCTLSSAIASGLAKGMGLRDAVRMAKAYLTSAIMHSNELHIGKGHGPVHHFHEWWSKQ